jgi:hypothetical protein
MAPKLLFTDLTLFLQLTAQAVSCRPLTYEVWVLSQSRSYYKQSGSGTVTRFYLVTTICTNATYLFINDAVNFGAWERRYVRK